MKCEDVRKLLHPFSDGELDVVGSVSIEEHLAECDECAAQEKELRSLKTAISSASLYHRAPEGLRARIQISMREIDRPPRRSFARLAAIAASLLLLVGASAMTAMYLSGTRMSGDDRVAELVVAAHVRSLQANHATDVESSDRHTVKPWFQGKLDFAPQVPDLAAQGFSLIGGRLDYLLDRPVAAIVYRYRLHPINLFIWPAKDGNRTAIRDISRQGFHIRTWQYSGMTYWAISDLGDHELDEFVRLYEEQSPVSSR